jgi:hypothetical protein
LILENTAHHSPQKGGYQPMSFWEEKYKKRNERKKKIYEILRNREDR